MRKYGTNKKILPSQVFPMIKTKLYNIFTMYYYCRRLVHSSVNILLTPPFYFAFHLTYFWTHLVSEKQNIRL